MILYTLHNSSLTMEVYEDKVIFHAKLWRGLLSREWQAPLVIPYAELQRVELHKRMWPVRHQLSFYTGKRAVHFNFRGLLPFYERLHLYFERQTIRYYNHPEGLPRPSKTVADLVAEKKARPKSKAFAA